ncbi:hypothetical protein D9758_017005 [Tetrapyrgos nigripes]|uniref:Xylanolytic transcriptional activator regulatory domain-containing protein n=1 Tax=Tetrapyrgos nigripes TaxID=182062 RepID=A0A8H5FDV1_9AGAR|nr:hypothetical protein D9758_017005 [Tetrapyrgos nigripes]
MTEFFLMSKLGQNASTGKAKSTIESELLRRAFWCLYILDIIVSTFMNRPRAISMDDLEVDLPIECDDEYWETDDPQHAFQQPLDKPSYVAACNAFIKLLDIMSFAQHSLYSVRRSHFWTTSGPGLSGPEWNEKVVKEIDTSLAKWLEDIPSHLKWNPHHPIENQNFFNQSTFLHAMYYWVQIFVHKASIPQISRHPGAVSTATVKLSQNSPSLVICVNAARSCCRVMEEQNKREVLPLHNVLMALYTSAVVLILNARREKRLHMHMRTSTGEGDVDVDVSSEMVDVYKCIKIIQSCESRWQAAGVELAHSVAAINDIYVEQ